MRGSQPSRWVSAMICRESSTAAYLPGSGTNFGAFGVNDMTRSLREGKRFSSASLQRHHRPRSALSSVGGKHPPLWGSARATYLRGISRFVTRRRDKSERVLERKAANPKLRMAGSGALPPEAPDPAPNQYTGSASWQAEEDRQGPLSGPRRTRQFEDQDRLRPLVYPKAKPGQRSSGPGPLEPGEIVVRRTGWHIGQVCDRRIHARRSQLRSGRRDGLFPATSGGRDHQKSRPNSVAKPL